MAAYVPTEYYLGEERQTALTAAEASQLEWEGWTRVSVVTNPPGEYNGTLPAYLSPESLDATYVPRREVHTGTNEPSVKRTGMLWFRPKQT